MSNDGYTLPQGDQAGSYILERTDLLKIIPPLCTAFGFRYRRSTVVTGINETV